MRFLKENAFLAATTLIVIAVAVVCLLLTRSFGSQAEEFAKQRKDLSASLASLLGGEPVNSRVLQAYEQYAAAVEHERAKVEDEFVRYNRRNYKVMTFTKGDTKQKVPAFPIDRDLYEKEGWRLLFPERYREELAALLQSMDPVKMPTPEDEKAFLEHAGRYVYEALKWMKVPDKWAEKGKVLVEGLLSEMLSGTPETTGEEE